MKNIIIIILVCCIHCVLPSQSLMAQTLHAILVADTIHDISAVTWPDVRRWQQELHTIANHTHMVLKEKIFSGKNFRQEKVKSYLQNLSVNKDDAIVFFFSGHGYRTQQKTTPWPFITFDPEKPGLDIQWIADTIRNKKPQFALVMTDCCNNYAEQEYINHTKYIDVNLNHCPPYYPGYDRLFASAKGCVVISSCSAGQFSYGSHCGGLYTQCFFTSMNHELSQKTPNWKNLLQRANSYIRNIQQPVSKVYP